jgi:hypothetical protein
MSEWDHLDEQDDAEPVSFTATAAALNALQQVGQGQVESFRRIVDWSLAGSAAGSRALGWTSTGGVLTSPVAVP